MSSFLINPLVHPIARTRKYHISLVMRILVICLGLLVNVALITEVFTTVQGFSAYTLLLLWYLFYEIKGLRRQQPQLIWLNPVVLSSLFTFVLAFGITNALYFLPENTLYELGMSPDITPWMNQLMLLVVLGAVSMWGGYLSNIGRNMGLSLQRSRVMKRWMSPSFKIKKSALYIGLSIDFIAKLLLIKLGLFGYSSSYDQLVAASAYTQYLSLASSLGTLVLVGVSVQCFAPARTLIINQKLLFFVLGYEVFFGLLSGFKSAVVMPFIIVGIVYYSQRNRFPRWLIPAVWIGLIVAYGVIEPFRAARNADAGFVGTNIGSIVSTMMSAQKVVHGDSSDDNNKAFAFISRNNLTYIGSLGIRYADIHNELPAGSPKFLENILIAPALALIPRFLWPSKPLENTGLWYTNEVMGLDLYSSTAMSPFTYLNFAGGPLAVILGFLIVGIVQRGLFDGLLYFGGGGLIVFFGLLGALVQIDSAFNTIFVGMIRMFPILVVVQFLLLNRVRR